MTTQLSNISTATVITTNNNDTITIINTDNYCKIYNYSSYNNNCKHFYDNNVIYSNNNYSSNNYYYHLCNNYSNNDSDIDKRGENNIHFMLGKLHHQIIILPGRSYHFCALY